MPKKKIESKSAGVTFLNEDADFLRDEAARLTRETGIRLSLRQVAVKIMRGYRDAKKGK